MSLGIRLWHAPRPGPAHRSAGAFDLSTGVQGDFDRRRMGVAGVRFDPVAVKNANRRGPSWHPQGFDPSPGRQTAISEFFIDICDIVSAADRSHPRLDSRGTLPATAASWWMICPT